MKRLVERIRVVGIVALILLFAAVSGQAQEKPNTRIMSVSYWLKMARLGLVPFNPQVPVKPGNFTGSQIDVLQQDSPDVAITNAPNVTQSENSVFVNPNNNSKALNSNNSTNLPVTTVYGTSDYETQNSGLAWTGHAQLPSGSNSGDPAAAIDLNGRYYVGGISNAGGQEVNYSTNEGTAWTKVQVAAKPPGPNSLADKNHLWVDNSPSSAFEGNLYSAWTDFGGPNDTNVVISRSTDSGATWSAKVNISSAVAAGSHNQGVNIQTGSNGEVYAAWAIYDSFPADEKAIGFAKSTDGGVTWQPATRIISNIRGIRNTGVSQNQRVNSFPSMAVDISGGPNNGNLYIVWANVGVPGINTGTDVDVYMIKSTNGGTTWSAPIRVNQDPSGLGKKHYFPWITCDPVTGNLSVIFYDNRNVTSTQVEVFVADSTDAGNTWVDFKVSDNSLTPAPIPGLASGYFGDYLGISARNGKVYPVWTSNHTGQALAYTSPFDFAVTGDVVAITKAIFFNTANLLYVAATSSAAPGADLSLTVSGCVDNVPMTFRASNGTYIYLTRACTGLGGQTATVTSSLGGSDSATIIGLGGAVTDVDGLILLETQLLQNSPNPFNPETWLPYQLASDANVQIMIYDMKGTLVRRLDLGHQRAGYYVERRNAAYWDGRSDTGELVSSGVYFYHFQAGDYHTTKKMLLLK